MVISGKPMIIIVINPRRPVVKYQHITIALQGSGLIELLKHQTICLEVFDQPLPILN